MTSSARLCWLVIGTALVGACGQPIPDRCDGSPFVCPVEWASGRIRASATPYQLDADTANDPVSGLMWQRKIPEEMQRWTAARDYCESLTLGGHDDWRLPSRLELLMLVDYPTSDPLPAPPPTTTSTTEPFGPPMIDAAAFPDTPPAMFWTASNTENYSHAEAWIIDFGSGRFHEEELELLLPRTRCVRTEKKAAPPLPEGRYVVTAGTVREPATGLVWERKPDSTMSYADAEKYCAALNLDGHDGFRLPTLKEAMSVVSAIATSGPAVDPDAFQVKGYLNYYFPTVWTSTPWVIPDSDAADRALAPGHRYIVELGSDGKVRTGFTERREDDPYRNMYSALCVRDENEPAPAAPQENNP